MQLDLIRFKELRFASTFTSYHLSIIDTTAEIEFKTEAGLLQGLNMLDQLVTRNDFGIRIYGVPINVVN